MKRHTHSDGLPRLWHYLLLVIMVTGFAAGGLPAGSCAPDLVIPTGRLAADQADVMSGDDGGILFDSASTISVARYNLPTELEYKRQMVPITNWRAVTSDQGDRVEGNVAIVSNNLTRDLPARTATFIGMWEVPGGSFRETREVKFHILVGRF